MRKLGFIYILDISVVLMVAAYAFSSHLAAGMPLLMLFCVNVVLIVIVFAQQVRFAENQHFQAGLVEMDEKTTDFINYVAHELKTPLTSLKLSTSLLLKHQDIDPKMRNDHLVSLKKEMTRMEKMINNFLNLARIGSKKLRITRNDCDLLEIIISINKLYLEKLAQKKMKVKVNIPENACQVWIDRERVSEIFSNIIDNSIKHGDKGSEIMITAEIVGSELHMSITNVGAPILDELKQDVFKKYYKATESRGAGIGLYVVKEIVEMHDGSIYIRDNIDPETSKIVGVTFQMKFVAKEEMQELKLA